MHLHGIPKHLARVRDLIDIAYTSVLVENSKKEEGHRLPEDALAIGFMVDTSQSVQRQPWGYQIPTITTSTSLYSFELDMLLPPSALFRFHGFPTSHQTTMSEYGQLSLVGESWSLPAMATAMYSFYLNAEGPWWNHSAA